MVGSCHAHVRMPTPSIALPPDWILREGPALVVAPVLAMHPEALASLCRAGVVDATGHSVLPGTSVLQLPMASVHDALEALSVVGRATGVGERAEDLEEKLRDKLARVAREARRRRKGEGGVEGGDA